MRNVVRKLRRTADEPGTSARQVFSLRCVCETAITAAGAESQSAGSLDPASVLRRMTHLAAIRTALLTPSLSPAVRATQRGVTA